MPLSKRVRVCWSLGKVNLMPCANAQGQAGALVIDEASRTSLQAEERAEQEELAHMMEEVLDAEEAAQEEGMLCVCGVCGLCACVRVGMYGYHIAAFIKTLAPLRLDMYLSMQVHIDTCFCLCMCKCMCLCS